MTPDARDRARAGFWNGCRSERRNEPGMSAPGMSPRDRGRGGTPLPRPALLFCPADRPDRYAKALAAADLVVLDLEDAVRPAAKQAAREALLANPVDPERVIVRVNAVGTPEVEADLAALRGTAYRMVMLPKAETPPSSARSPAGRSSPCARPRSAC